jgi:signal transduction histidine kinase
MTRVIYLSQVNQKSSLSYSPYVMIIPMNSDDYLSTLDLHQVFRYFTGTAMAYFAILAISTAIQTGQGDSLLQVQAYINFGTNLIQFIYLSISFFRRRLRRAYLPIALVNATIIPIFSNLIYLADPLEDISYLITRSWLIFPILIVPIVMIAGEYRFRYAVMAVILTTYVELFSLYPHIQVLNTDSLQIFGGPLIRAFAIGTVAYIVNRMVALQRAQRRELILANVRLGEHAQTLEQLATSRERNRIARELHDTLAHTLSGEAVNLEAIKLMLPTSQAEIHTMLQSSLDNTRAGLAETRRVLKALRSRQLDDLGLSIAIRSLATDAASRANFNLSTNIADTLPELTPDVEQCIFRIAQEALENIVRHAKAAEVEVEFGIEAQSLILTVTDDGLGFDPRYQISENLGLQGIQERAELVHGELKIRSDHNAGTSIQLSVPFYSVNQND